MASIRNIPQIEVQVPKQVQYATTVRQSAKKVYLGLPIHLGERIIWVDREYRTNPLSRIPGGYDVIVEYHDERVLGYDWIKKPWAYIETFFAGMVDYPLQIFNDLDEVSKLEIAKNTISRFYARDHNTNTFEEIWNADTACYLPWVALKRRYDIEGSYYYEKF